MNQCSLTLMLEIKSQLTVFFSFLTYNFPFHQKTFTSYTRDTSLFFFKDGTTSNIRDDTSLSIIYLFYVLYIIHLTKNVSDQTLL